MLRALTKTHKALTPEQREYFYPLLAAAAFINPALLLAPGAVAAGEAAADATKATVKGIAGAVSRWRQRRRDAAEENRRAIEDEKRDRELREKRYFELRNRPTLQEMLDDFRKDFDEYAAAINALPGLDEAEQQARINKKLDWLVAMTEELLKNKDKYVRPKGYGE